MVSKKAQQVIKTVFPDVQINSYHDNESFISIENLPRKKAVELIEATESVCEWEIKGEWDLNTDIQIIFKDIQNG